MQDIVKETDDIKKELDSKSITIKQLAIENKLLCGRLTQAQKEAEELIKFTRSYLKPDSIRPYK